MEAITINQSWTGQRWKSIFPASRWLLALFLAGMAQFSIHAQVNHYQDIQFLFVFDTSYSMKSIESSLRQTAAQYVENGLNGWMKLNSPYQVWAFDNRLRASLPPANYEPLLSKALASETADFIKKQDFSPSSDYAAMMTEIRKYAQTKPHLVAIVFNDGDDFIKATPFDKEINDIYSLRRKEARRQRLPLVTILALNQGAFASGSVVIAGETIPIESINAALKLPIEPAPSKPATPVPTARETRPIEQPQPSPVVQAPTTNIPPTPATTNLVLAATNTPVPPAIKPAKPASVEPTNSIAVPSVSTPPAAISNAPAATPTNVTAAPVKPVAQAPVIPPAIITNTPVVPPPSPRVTNVETVARTVPTPAVKTNAPPRPVAEPAPAPLAVKTNLVSNNLSASNWTASISRPTNVNRPASAPVKSSKMGFLWIAAIIATTLLIGMIAIVWFMRRKPAAPTSSLISQTIRELDHLK